MTDQEVIGLLKKIDDGYVPSEEEKGQILKFI